MSGIPVATRPILQYVSAADPAFGTSRAGSSDDTAQLVAAATAAAAASKPLLIPPGSWNIKSLPGGLIDNANIHVYGAGKGQTTITLDSSSRFLVCSTAYNQLIVEDLATVGGIDIIKSTYTGAGVLKPKHIRRCQFVGYTGCAIQSNTYDGPYWNIDENWFDGAASTDTTTCIALSGYTDQCRIMRNSFVRYRCAVKLLVQQDPNNSRWKGGGQNATLALNEFIHLSNSGGASTRVRLWVEVVPSGQAIPNTGQGFASYGNKWGAENLRSGDRMIVYAQRQAGVGTDAGTYWPDLSTASTGIISHHHFFGELFANSNPSAGAASYIDNIWFTTSPNLRECRFGGQAFGAPFINPIGLLGGTAPYDAYNQGNICEIHSFDDGIATSAYTAANDGSLAKLIDPTGQHEGALKAFSTFPGGASPVGFTNLLTTRVGSWTVNPHGSAVGSVTDPLGGTEAKEWSLGDGSAVGIVGGNVTGTTAGEPAYAQLYLKGGASGTAATEVFVITDFASGAGNSHFQRRVSVDSSWRLHRFQWIPRDTSATLRLAVTSIGTADPARTVQVGLPHVYHAREPQPVDGFVLQAPDNSAYTVGVNTSGALTGVTVSANVVAPTQQANMWYTPTGTTSTLAMTLNKVYAIPFDVYTTQTVTRMALEITSAATSGGVVRLGIYSDNGGSPGTAILDAGTIDATVLYSTTPGQITGLSKSLTPARYYLCAVAQTAAPTVRSVNTPHDGVGFTTAATPPANTSNAGYAESGTASTSTLSGSFPANTSLGNVPRVCIRT